jgi:hypothetical protein
VQAVPYTWPRDQSGRWTIVVERKAPSWKNGSRTDRRGTQATGLSAQ